MAKIGSNASDAEFQSLDTEQAVTTKRADTPDYTVKVNSDPTTYVIHDKEGNVVYEDATPDVIVTAIEANPRKHFHIADDIALGTQTLDIDLGGNRGFELTMGGDFVPSYGIQYVMKLQNGVNMNVQFKVRTGGDYKYIQDFAKNTTGLDTALYLEGTQSIALDFESYQFAGRCVEVAPSSYAPKSHRIKVHSIMADGCGQGFYWNTNKTGTGGVDSGWINAKDGSYFDANDLSIGDVEVYLTGTEGALIENCSAVHVDGWNIGLDMDPLVTYRSVNNLTISRQFAGGAGGGSGIVIQDCTRVEGHLTTSDNADGYGLTIDGVQDGNSIIHRSKADKRSLLLTSTNQGNGELSITEHSFKADERGVFVENGGGGVTIASIEGNITNANETSLAGESSMHVDSASHILELHDLQFESGNVDYHIDVPSGNKLSLLGGRFLNTPASGLLSNEPESADNVRGFETRNGGTENVAVDSAGTFNITGITHGLDVTPQSQDFELHVGFASATDFSFDYLRIDGVDSTSFNVRGKVGSASATGGANADIVWSVDTGA